MTLQSDPDVQTGPDPSSVPVAGGGSAHRMMGGSRGSADLIGTYAKPALIGAAVGGVAGFLLPGIDLGRGALWGAVGGIVVACMKGGKS